MEGARMQEGMDLKRLFLLTVRKIWIVLLAAAAGALVGCACYLVVHVVFAPQREYEAVSKLYIDFEERSTGEAYQYYNGYTWDDLMKTDPILKYTMTLLPQDYEEELVRDSITAEILTDIRLLTITVRTHDPEQTEEILAATEQSLIHFASVMRELEQITVFRTTQPALVVFELQTLRVAALCAALCAIAAFLLLLLFYALDDAIYLPLDAVQRYGIPVLGVRGWHEEELQLALEYRYQNKAYEDKIRIVAYDECISPSAEFYEDLRKSELIVLEIPCGRKIGKALQHVLEQLRLQDCPVDGLILYDADCKLLNQYYFNENIRKGAKRGREEKV